ncbi:MAG: hypothetical protein EH225_13000 [Calditrichaeota bacterium]|nr:LPS export ABC transporter periplasmic protein LptC [Calditrichota bacterium]RQV98576.1 MAG: hypothetical protein EH225_13000 [Calditrichota bacterium]
MSGIPSSFQKSAFYVVLLALLTAVMGQTGNQQSSGLELLHADLSRGVEENGIPLKILSGNVHARQDSLELFCDRAVYNQQSGEIHLRGNVRLYRGQDTLLAEEVRYFEENQIAVAEGNVHVFRPGQELRSEYLEYHYNTNQIRARRNVYLHDSDNRVYITARQGEYIPDADYSYVRGNAHLWRVDSTTTDTIHIFCRQQEYHFGESRRAVARDSVHIYQGNLHATCDSAVYQIEEDIIYLMSEPVAIQENNKMTGRQMQLILENRELKRIRIDNEARAVSLLDSLAKKQNTLEGREIILYITDRELHQIQAISNARSFYYLREQEEEQGINVASADTIKVFIKENALDSISVIGGSQGTYYPPDYKGKIVQE